MPSLINSYIADRVIDQITDLGKHAITRMVATDAVDAIIKLLGTYKPEASRIAQLLSGVTDPDGPSLSITALSIATGSGTLVNNGNGTWS